MIPDRKIADLALALDDARRAANRLDTFLAVKGARVGFIPRGAVSSIISDLEAAEEMLGDFHAEIRAVLAEPVRA